MRSTYEQAMTKVFEDEGGYTNDPRDPGGPTNWGITLEDARHYWKSDATAEDVKNMPKTIAENIYEEHYAKPVAYDALPAGVDYTVLDYAINSGISRSVKTLQRMVGTDQDGIVGGLTIAATNKCNSGDLIDRFYDARLSFLRSLSSWDHFGRGWGARCATGRVLAHKLAQTPMPVGKAPEPTPIKTKSLFEVLYELLLKFMGRS